MKKLLTLAAMISVLVPHAHAQTDKSVLPGGLLVYGTAGTTGVGLGLGTQVHDKVSLRAEVTGSSYSIDEKNDDLAVNGKLNLESAGIYGDFFPFSGAFRITGGVMFKSPNGSVTAVPDSGTTANIGNVEYTFGANDTLTGTVKYPSTMPYVGIGWGFSSLKEKGFKFGLDVGAAVGTLKSSLSASQSLINLGANAGKDISTDLAAEEKKLNDKLNKVGFFPVLKVSVGYAF